MNDGVIESEHRAIKELKIIFDIIKWSKDLSEYFIAQYEKRDKQ